MRSTPIRKATDIICFLKEKGQFLFLSALCLFSATLQFLWLSLDRTPPVGDGIPCILRGMFFFQLQNKLGFWAVLKEAFRFNDTYPALIDFTYFLYYRLFGLSSEMELMVNSIYLIIGIIGVYGIGKCLFNKNTGLFSALLFTSLPGVLTYSKLGFKEFQLMCFLALTLYFLLQAKNFTNRNFSVLFGISSGLMMVTKCEGLVFLIIPLTIVLIKIISSKTLLRDRTLHWNVALMLIIAFLVGFSWYILNWQELSAFMLYRMHNRTMLGIYFSTEELGSYFNWLGSELLTQFYIFLFVIISGYSLLKGLSLRTRTSEIKRVLVLCLYFAFPFLVFTFLSGKSSAHILPLSVFISLIIAGGCNTIKNKFIKFVLIGLIFLHAVNIQLIPFLAADYNREALPWTIKLSPIDHFLYKFRYMGGFVSAYGFQRRVTKDNWDVKLKEILKFIKEDYRNSKYKDYTSSKKASVLLLANNEPFRFQQLKYYNMKEYMPVSLISIIFSVNDVSDNMEENIFGNKYEYILMEDPNQFINWMEEAPLIGAMEFISDNAERFQQNYRIVKEFELPRSSKATVYKGISSSVDNNKSVLR